jgi:hypothetical protein
MKFTDEEYEEIAAHAFRDDYAGYRPAVQESPNGDGVWDEGKRYAHVALKYDPPPALRAYFELAYLEALNVCVSLDVPARLMPDPRECCLRILDYPPGAGSAQHTDFDFLTIQLYRDRPEGFVRLRGESPGEKAASWHESDDKVSGGIHFGEMAEVAGFRRATPHLVRPLDVRQRAIVFFVLPHPDAALLTAGEWLADRYSRSRRCGGVWPRGR